MVPKISFFLSVSSHLIAFFFSLKNAMKVHWIKHKFSYYLPSLWENSFNKNSLYLYGLQEWVCWRAIKKQEENKLMRKIKMRSKRLHGVRSESRKNFLKKHQKLLSRKEYSISGKQALCDLSIVLLSLSSLSTYP